MYIPMITEFIQSMFVYGSDTWEDIQSQKLKDEINELTKEDE